MEKLVDLVAPRSCADLLVKAFLLVTTFTFFDWLVGHATLSLTEGSVVWSRAVTFMIGAPFGLFVMAVLAVQRRLKARLRHLSETDVLTTLANRASFMARAEDAIESGMGAAVLMLDVDHFKSINDTHGHYAGDVALQQIGAHIRAQTRENDIVGRIGGEEFAVLLADTNPEGVVAISNRFCQDISVTLTHDNSAETIITFSVTLSVGGVRALPNHSLIDLMCAADKALYKAKAAGRNRVVFQSAVMCREQTADAAS